MKIVSISNNDPTIENLTQELIDIDRQCLGDLDMADEGDLDYWTANRKSTFAAALYDGSKIVGYIDLIALSNNGVRQLKSGDWHDGKIDQIFIADLSSHSTALYLIAVAILPKYRRQGWAKKLWNYSAEQFSKNGYSIRDIYAVTWTPNGFGFLKSFRPEIIGRDSAGHPIIRIKTLNGKMPIANL
ncbi:MAG: GNAT family N-acetyltransferase [Candidatus Buchananbacteria bacterium]|nr:GNAT family N-acetyltransferase [Candidatus Buchananbacteria bacterium]